MALVKFLKIAADGLESEHDPATDSISVLDVTMNSVSLGGTGGVDVIGDLASAYTNFTPAGNFLQDTLNAIDTAIGLVNTNNSYVSVTYTNGEASPITVGQAVYIDSNNTVKLAINNNAAKDDPIGVVKPASIAAAGSGLIITEGLAAGALSGATAGNKYFLDSTSGAMTATVPVGSGKNVVLMGYAKNATDLQVRIQNIGKRT
jgi:hypothetical protein